MSAGRLRAVALAANAALALAVLLLPWYALDDYVPNGWDATWAAKLALAIAVANIALLRLDLPAPAAALAALACVLIALRVAFPPDFGFDFDGLDVPVERRFGCYVALAAAALAAQAAALARGGVSE